MNSGLKLLVADDDLAFIELVKGSRLSNLFEIKATHSLEETYNTISTEDIDLLILDNGFPDGESAYMVRNLLNDAKNKKMCLIFATSDHDKDIDFELVTRQRGAHGFMYKPIVCESRLFRQVLHIWDSVKEKHNEKSYG